MTNLFKPGDKVKTGPTISTIRLNGTVKYIACKLATGGGGKLCDKKHCQHLTKDKEFVWVVWASGETFSYHYSELAYDEVSKTTSQEKSEYLDKTKQVIKDTVSPKKQDQAEIDFWRAYNGFTKVKADKFGRVYVHEVESAPKQELKNEEVNFAVYNGFEKGSVKKASV